MSLKYSYSLQHHTQQQAAKYRVIHKSFQIKIQFESNTVLPSFSKNKNQRKLIKKTEVFSFVRFVGFVKNDLLEK